MKTIDLGKTYDGIEAAEPAEDSKEPKVHYPSLYLSDRPELANLPDEGTATIKFKVVSRSVNERDGEKTVSTELEIHSITADTESKANGEDESLDEIEKGLREAEEASETPEEEADEAPEEDEAEGETPKKKK
jgi:hypothetical protein